MSNHPDDDDYSICPCCGAELPGGASFCRECGASNDSGWTDGQFDPDYGDDDFDYDEYIAREFPDQPRDYSKPDAKRLFVGIVVVLLCVSLLLWSFCW